MNDTSGATEYLLGYLTTDQWLGAIQSRDERPLDDIDKEFIEDVYSRICQYDNNYGGEVLEEVYDWLREHEPDAGGPEDYFISLYEDEYGKPLDKDKAIQMLADKGVTFGAWKLIVDLDVKPPELLLENLRYSHIGDHVIIRARCDGTYGEERPQ